MNEQPDHGEESYRGTGRLEGTDEQACQQGVDRELGELGGIDMLVDNAAYQMAQPGGIADITTEQFDFGAETPLGRAGQPAELAPAYVYLASQESSFVTGAVLAVTGGLPL